MLCVSLHRGTRRTTFLIRSLRLWERRSRYRLSSPSLSLRVLLHSQASPLWSSELRSGSKRAVCDREALRQHGMYFLYFHCLSMLISFCYLTGFISCSMVSLVLSCYALKLCRIMRWFGLSNCRDFCLPPLPSLLILLFAIRLMIFEIATGDKSLDLVIPVSADTA
jgi:hypothetical protein